MTARKMKQNKHAEKKFCEILFPATRMAGGIIQSETGAEEFVLLNKEATTLAFSLYIPAQTQIQM